MVRDIVVKLRREYSDNKRILTETIIFIIISVATLLLFHIFDVTEKFYEFTRSHDNYELDEIVLSLSAISLLLFIFVTRRFLELRTYIIKANTDSLIGIFNRRKGSDLIIVEMEKAKKRGQSISLIMYDLDNFKTINDTFGHNVGDAVLVQVAAIVNNKIRVRDSHIRWGGEEFVILCPDTGIDGAMALAERCREKIASADILEGRNISASFGVIQVDLEMDLRDNISVLDKMLYKSKESGKNNVICSLSDGLS